MNNPNSCDHKWEFVRRGDPDEAEVPTEVFFCPKCGVYQDRPILTADSTVSEHSKIRRESK